MRNYFNNQKGITPIAIILIVVGVLGIIGGGTWYWQKQKEKPVKVEAIKIGDCVECVWGSEDTVVKDKKEYGPPTKSERIADGIVTDIQEGEVSIKLESIADFRYIKKFFLWLPDLSMLKHPPYLIGDIYKCKKPQIKEVENGLVVTKIYNSIKRIPCTSAEQAKPIKREQSCIQVITPAVSPEGMCKEFPTPCEVPSGWKKIEKCPTSLCEKNGGKVSNITECNGEINKICTFPDGQTCYIENIKDGKCEGIFSPKVLCDKYQ